MEWVIVLLLSLPIFLIPKVSRLPLTPKVIAMYVTFGILAVGVAIGVWLIPPGTF